MSYDNPEDNAGWHEMMGFSFPLLSDEDHAFAIATGAEREPGSRLYGHAPLRHTYLIDPEGVVRAVWDVGREIQGHAAAVLEEHRRLTS